LNGVFTKLLQISARRLIGEEDSMSHRIAAAALALVALFGLTACTGSPGASTDTNSGADSTSSDQPGDEGQSTADACALIQKSIEDATQEFAELSSSDSAAVVEAMNAAAEGLGTTATQITNDEVAALIPPLQEMFTGVAEVMASIASGDETEVEGLSQVAEKFRETGEAFQETCAP
jgi:hypothetical protein